MRRWLAIVCVLAAAPADAQEVFPRFDFHLDGQYVSTGDRRFDWVFDFGADLDIVRARPWRATFIADYEAIAGHQFRRFDVNQGNYLLEGALLFTAGSIEIGPVWHHVSRHLSDRAKRFPVDWNMISVRARSQAISGRVFRGWSLDARATVTNAFVDYTWELEGAGAVRYGYGGRSALIGAAGWRVIGVDGSRNRGTQLEWRGEAGVRVDGHAAAAEVFVGVERRVDPYPIEFGRETWFLAGLRFVSR
jgi:hypothetical protein